jgi:hypothetical protein
LIRRNLKSCLTLIVSIVCEMTTMHIHGAQERTHAASIDRA